MQRDGALLAQNNSTLAPTTPVRFMGGRAALAVVATAFPTTCQLQVLGPDGVTWLNEGANITANGVTILDLHEGQYRMNLAGVGVTGLYAALACIPYG